MLRKMREQKGGVSDCGGEERGDRAGVGEEAEADDVRSILPARARSIQKAAAAAVTSRTDTRRCWRRTHLIPPPTVAAQRFTTTRPVHRAMSAATM